MTKETETNMQQNELDCKPITIFCMKYGLRNETFNLRTLLGTPSSASVPKGLKIIFSGRDKRRNGISHLEAGPRCSHGIIVYCLDF